MSTNRNTGPKGINPNKMKSDPSFDVNRLPWEQTAQTPISAPKAAKSAATPRVSQVRDDAERTRVPVARPRAIELVEEPEVVMVKPSNTKRNVGLGVAALAIAAGAAYMFSDKADSDKVHVIVGGKAVQIYEEDKAAEAAGLNFAVDLCDTRETYDYAAEAISAALNGLDTSVTACKMNSPSSVTIGASTEEGGSTVDLDGGGVGIDKGRQLTISISKLGANAITNPGDEINCTNGESKFTVNNKDGEQLSVTVKSDVVACNGLDQVAMAMQNAAMGTDNSFGRSLND